MSRIVRHFLMATPSIEAGSQEFWVNGAYDFVVPIIFNNIRFRMTGAGGGGYRYLGGIGGAGGAYGTAGGNSAITALGLRATGGGGYANGYGGAGGVGTGGDINGNGTVGYTNAAPTRGVPVPSLGASGYGSDHGGGGGGYVEKLFAIGDPAVLPGTVIRIVLGKGGQNSVSAQSYGVDGGCVIDWF